MSNEQIDNQSHAESVPIDNYMPDNQTYEQSPEQLPDDEVNPVVDDHEQATSNAQSSYQDDDNQDDDEITLPPKAQAQFNRRVQKLNADAVKYKRQVAELQAQIQAYNTVPIEVGNDYFIDPSSNQRYQMPKVSDYGNDFARYIEDRDQYFNAQNRAINTGRQRMLAQQSEQVNKRSFAVQINQARQVYSDFDNMITSPYWAAIEKAQPNIVRVLERSPYGAEIAYQLAKDPESLDNFTLMDDLDMVKYIGHLEAKRGQSSNSPKLVSNAPAPTRNSTPGKGGSVQMADKNNPHSWSVAEMAKRMREKG